jgi:hypothetical protein
MVDMLRVGSTRQMFAQVEPGEGPVRYKKIKNNCGPKKGGVKGGIQQNGTEH